MNHAIYKITRDDVIKTDLANFNLYKHLLR